VHDECARIKRGVKFIPPGPLSPGESFVASDIVESVGTVLHVDEAKTQSIAELEVEFTLSTQQVQHQAEWKTGVSLAIRAANLLSQAQDVVLLRGQSAVDGKGGEQDPLFRDGTVRLKTGPAGSGLLRVGTLPADQTIPVPRLASKQNKWSEHTSDAVGLGYAALQAKGHYGPYALVLHTVPYADTYTALPNTLIMPADRIKPMVTAGFYGSGAMPPLTGILVSVGGNSMDLVRGQDAIVAYLFEDRQGYHFRVYERFALRLKSLDAVIKLGFDVAPN
jgi:uncharacterized linocin/CFP29 family protein